MLSKEDMEKAMAKSGRSIKHYHINNGRFADNGFVDALNSKGQKLTFCRVVAYHKNVILENENKVLTTGAHTLLLHGIRIWHQMINDIFWPVVMSAVEKWLNSLQVNTLGRTPESILHGVEVQDIPVKSYHTLFFPTYVLDARLQSDGGAGLLNRSPRLQIGVYLGH